MTQQPARARLLQAFRDRAVAFGRFTLASDLGLEVGAIPMAVALAQRYALAGKPLEGFFVRKQAQGARQPGARRGRALARGARGRARRRLDHRRLGHIRDFGIEPPK